MRSQSASLRSHKSPLDEGAACDYSNYMKAKLVKFGRSQGVLLPHELLQAYSLVEGDDVDIEARRDCIVLHPVAAGRGELSYAAAYQEMAEEATESADWAAWDITAGHGLEH